MTWLGVPVLDWVLLVVLLGFGVEAWLTTRSSSEPQDSGNPQTDQETTEPPKGPDQLR